MAILYLFNVATSAIIIFRGIEVMSTSSRGAAADCVRLQSSDGDTFEVSLKVAKLSRTIETMLRDLGHEPDDLIPIPKVNTRILKKVLGWAEHEIQEQLSHHQPCAREGGSTSTAHVPATSSQSHTPISPTTSMAMPPAPTPFQPRPQACVPQRSSRQLRPPPPRHMLTDWEKEFISKNKDELYDLLLAANYLDIKSLLDVLCRTVADMIKGNDPEEIRRKFHVTNPTYPNSDTPPSSPSPHPNPSTHHPETSKTRDSIHSHEEEEATQDTSRNKESAGSQLQPSGHRETPV